MTDSLRRLQLKAENINLRSPAILLPMAGEVVRRESHVRMYTI